MDPLQDLVHPCFDCQVSRVYKYQFEHESEEYGLEDLEVWECPECFNEEYR